MNIFGSAKKTKTLASVMQVFEQIVKDLNLISERERMKAAESEETAQQAQKATRVSLLKADRAAILSMRLQELTATTK